jgi:two-component system, LytTR family, sensor histidine kinase AlgZ
MTDRVRHRALYIGTLGALAEWKRFIPITLVTAPIVVLQQRMSQPRFAAWIGVMMCVSFVLISPASWRIAARYLERSRTPLGRILPFIVYGVLGIFTVWLVGVKLPTHLQIGATLLTAPASLLVCVALFWVGGWGLARDIDMENSIAERRIRFEALERTAKHAELLALRQHLDPHFLFNTLNAIAEWCREDPIAAEKAILQLSRVLRTIMEAIKQPVWALEEELQLVDLVLGLHALRDPDRFTVERAFAAGSASLLLPPMLLLPLVENAMKHGPESGNFGVLTLRTRCQADELVIEIENQGTYRGRRPEGEGLQQVEERLALAYSGKARFTIVDTGSERTLAQVVLPRPPP